MAQLYHNQLQLGMHTRNIQENPENRYVIKIKRKIQGIGKGKWKQTRLFDHGKSVHNGHYFSSHSKRIQDVEQVVSQEKKPCWDFYIHQLKEIEKVSRNFYQWPAIYYNNSRLKLRMDENIHEEGLLTHFWNCCIYPQDE